MCVYARTKNCSWLFDFNCVSNNYEYYYPADLQKQIDHGTGKGFEKCNGAHALAAERARTLFRKMDLSQQIFYSALWNIGPTKQSDHFELIEEICDQPCTRY